MAVPVYQHVSKDPLPKKQDPPCHTSSLRPVATSLEFLPAAARARVVSPNLRTFKTNLLHFLLTLRCLGRRPLLLGHRKLTNLIVRRLTYIPNASRLGPRLKTHFEDNICNTVLDSA